MIFKGSHTANGEAGRLTTHLGLKSEHPAFLKLNRATAVAFLMILGFATEADASIHECSCDEAQNAIAQAEPKDLVINIEGRRSVIVGSEELAELCERFVFFLMTMENMGADHIHWS